MVKIVRNFADPRKPCILVVKTFNCTEPLPEQYDHILSLKHNNTYFPYHRLAHDTVILRLSEANRLNLNLFTYIKYTENTLNQIMLTFHQKI